MHAQHSVARYFVDNAQVELGLVPVSLTDVIEAQGFAVAVAFGTPSLDNGIAVAGIAVPVAFGTATLVYQSPPVAIGRLSPAAEAVGKLDP